MNKERQGGARLDKNKHPQRKGSDPQGNEAKGGMSRQVKIGLIIAAVAVALILVGLAIRGAVGGWLPELPTQPAADEADPLTGEFPDKGSLNSASRKKDYFTFLVVGRDTGGGGNTDTIMLAAYDVPNQKLNVMSIPRDTMVDANHPDRNRKINGVWNLGLYYAKKDSKKQGIDYLKEAVGHMMGFTPDFYVIVNWEAFGRLVDAIGGVDFEVPFDMKYKDPTQDLVIDQPKGFRHLSGSDAMQVVRWRHNNSFSVQYADADLGRIRTQQALMKEVVKSCLKIENVTRIGELANIFTEEVETDLTPGNLIAFAQRAIFGGLSMDNVTFTTMPNTGANVRGDSYVQAKPEELLGLLNDGFNPYTEDLEMKDLHILQYSASSGYYTYSGTGKGTPPTYTAPQPAKPLVKATAEPEADQPPEAEPDPSASPDPDSSEPPEGSASPQPGGEETDAPEKPSGLPEEGETEPSDKPGAPPEPVDTPEPAPVHDPNDLGIPMD